ncbi:MAG: hypothetical protein ACRD96_14250 [Bryobacteraceae bacterium]
MREFARLSAALTALFVVVYGGTNWINSQRSGHYRLYFDWELAIPFVPPMIYLYLSLNLFLALTLRLDANALRAYAKAFALATVVAAAIHLALPARLGFDRRGSGALYAWLYRIELPYNLFPSLHVAYTTMTGRALAGERSGPAFRAAVRLWAGLLVASVVFVHQHHLADVAGGIALGWLCAAYYRYERDRAR